MSPTISGLFFLIPLTLCLSLHPHLTSAATNNAAAAPTTLNNAAAATPTPTALNNSTKNATSNLIEKACSGSRNQAFCLSVLKSDPGSKTADLKGLAFIALQAASKNATKTSVKIQLWLNDTEAEPTLDDALRACDQAYIDVVDQIGDSVNALVSGANGDVQTWMKAAVADIDTCDVGVKGLTVTHAVELTKKNRALRQLCNTALGIVRVLAHS
ncbi:hypothetical protein RHMOL_Rhmol13G0012700 [Rhododendron molle]|uniref:Uncharacterized protein n=1 Tax=Rhododendron molle TaxID=49168 RepID=A0ACC0L2N7_RHOML|nr:hypothetical protein RHMOL_Rhmol13G0012700 [Rhododendron molle]